MRNGEDLWPTLLVNQIHDRIGKSVEMVDAHLFFPVRAAPLILYEKIPNPLKLK